MMDVDVKLTEREHDMITAMTIHTIMVTATATISTIMNMDTIRATVTYAEHHSQERNLAMISEIIDSGEIAEKAKELSKQIFKEIAVAEAKAHGKNLEEVHFHEVGAIDSIVDIVGVAICVAALDPDVVYASPLHDGNGFIQCRHGLLPVPVPQSWQCLRVPEFLWCRTM